MARAIRFEKGEVVADRYQIDELIGDGGMGVVYSAEHTGTGRRCALKLIRPELVSRPEAVDKFLEEARVTGRIGSHPNIVDVFDTGRDDKHAVPFLAMELLEGSELHVFAEQHAPLSIQTLCSLLQQLASALDEAHARGIVHRDLKMTNLFVTRDHKGELALKVLDFGIAKTLEGAAQTATVIGTPSYAAPEQLGAGLRKMAADRGYTIATGICPATDVYAVALIAYELLTGHDAAQYWGETEMSELMLLTALEPRKPPSVRAQLRSQRLPPGFDEWFLRCTAHNADDRIQRAGEAIEALIKLIRGEPVELSRYALGPSPSPGGPPQAAPFAAAPPPADAAAPTQPALPPAATQPQLPLVPAITPPVPPVIGGLYGAPPPQPQSSKLPFIILGGMLLLGTLLIGGVGYLAYELTKPTAETDDFFLPDHDGDRDKPTARADAPQGHEQAVVPVSSKDPAWGSALAPVTIVEFASFQCGFCRKVNATLEQLRDKYGPDKLRIVYKSSPLSKEQQTHEAAMIVYQLGGSEAFWKFHGLAYESMDGQDPESLGSWAERCGVDRAKLAAALGSHEQSGKVEEDKQLGRRLGVQGTPSFFINGVSLRGAQPVEKFEAVIDEQLAAAQRELRAGTAPGRIYPVLARRNFAGPTGPELKPEGDKKPSDDSTTVWKVPVSAGDPQKGPPGALVTIVVFSEFQCPFCARARPTLDQLLIDYGPKLRIVWKDNPLPFHKRAEPAAQLAREAYEQKGNDGFWKAHDLLLDNQQQLEDQDLWRYAATLGLNGALVRAAVTTHKHKDAIEACQEQARDFEATGTPQFFINGRRLVGAKPAEAFKEIIDEEIIKANRLLGAGVPPGELYRELTKDGQGPAEPERKEVGPVPSAAPWRGSPVAKVVIHEFSDFQCPFCKRVNETLEQVLASYGTQVKIVWRHKPLPFHKEAALAHEAAQEAFEQKGNDGFWKMHNLLFDNQRKEAGSGGLERPALEQYAAQLGLDLVRFRAALDSRKHQAFVEQEIAASDRVGIRGTPTFVINGYLLTGAQPIAKFRQTIERALREAP